MDEPSTPPGPARDPLFALLLGNGLWGALLGVAFVVGAIALDIGHLRKLIGFSADGAIALGLLLGGSIITFASVAMGGAIMMIAGREPRNPRRGLPKAAPLTAIPLRLPARGGWKAAHPKGSRRPD